MIIDSIKLSGWRSYDADGIHIDGLKSINLIIGPNNCGKSNLSKYFHYLKCASSKEVLHSGFSSFKSGLEESQTWGWKKESICCEISLSKDNEIESEDKVFYKASEHKVTLNSCHHVRKDISTLSYNIDGKAIFNQDGQIRDGLNSDVWVDPSDEVDGFHDNSTYWSRFLESLVFVDPIRHHSRNSDNNQKFYFDGAMIIDELNKLRGDDSNKSKWVEFQEQIKTWLSDILLENVTSVEVSGKGLRLGFNNKLLFSLDELGTGVSQIVMLLSHLWINKTKKLNVFLEEPEANLHPDSVVKMVSIFERELPNHKFFITTHSPSLIDCLNDNWAVYRTSKNQEGASKITSNDNIIKYYETLDELGVKASQILQANTVIWVEGPSDRIYIKKWIEVYTDGKLKEGKDFSFLYFGGTNLASFTVLDDIDQDFINMLSTSRKGYLIADSDCSEESERTSKKFKRYLESMMARLEEANESNKGLSSSVSDYFKVWITDGREIENYINKDLLFNVLTEKGFKRDYIGKGEEKKLLELKIDKPSDFVFDKYDSFDKAISSFYQFSGGTSLDSSTEKNIALSYASKKVAIAKSIADKWSEKYATECSLNDELKKLVEFIGK